MPVSGPGVEDASVQRSGEVALARIERRARARSQKISEVGLNQLLGLLHTTHHSTLRPKAMWIWALFADLLALTLWALSRLAIWWQLKPTRTAGIVAILVALAIAAAVRMGIVG